MIEIVEDQHASRNQSWPEILQAGANDLVQPAIEKQQLELQMWVDSKKLRKVLLEVEIVQPDHVAETLHRYELRDPFERRGVKSLLDQLGFVALRPSALEPVETVNQGVRVGLEHASELGKEYGASAFPDAGLRDV